MFKLVSNFKIFLIPSKFRFLTDVNQEIYSTLQEKKEYSIKSSVSKETFQSFINHWIFGEIPVINSENFKEYEMLSKEFDLMQDLLQLYKNKVHNDDDFTRLSQNIELTQEYNNTKIDLQKKENQYKQIISILSNNEKGLNSYQKYQNMKSYF